jgi:hypothetical protein
MKSTVITPNIVTEIAQAALKLAVKNNGISRNKAFSEAFERVETQWGKAALTDGVKRELRDAVDKALKEQAKFTKHEVVTREQHYANVNGDGDLLIGRRVTTLDTQEKEIDQELLILSRFLNEHRSKVAVKKDGASEGDIRKERRLRNAINARLHECKVANIGNEIVENVFKYVAGLPPIRNTITNQLQSLGNVEVKQSEPETVNK